MLFIYRLSLGFYRLAAVISSFWSVKAGQWVRGQDAALRSLREGRIPGKHYIWMHVASLGEYEQGKPLIERLKADFPDYRICLTFFSPSGFDIVSKTNDDRLLVSYLPLDSPHNANSFLEILRPSIAIFVKYDFWYFYLSELHNRKVPLLVISAFFRQKQWLFSRAGKFMLDQIAKAKMIFTQDEQSVRLLKDRGIHNTMMAGDTRVDRVIELGDMDYATPSFFQEGELALIAGSTWPEDEQVILPWVNQADHRVCIAPHDISHGRIASIREKITKSVFRFSDMNDNYQSQEVLLIDSIGQLKYLYRFANVAFIGGGFGKGIHNILEPAVYGIPIIFAPKYRKFPEAMELTERGAAFSIKDTDEFQEVMQKLENPALRVKISEILTGYFKEKSGAVERIANWIKEQKLPEHD